MSVQGVVVKHNKTHHHSSVNASSPASRHSREYSVIRLTPVTRSAQIDSEAVRKVYARCEDMTPMDCKTAFRESRDKTAGWLIHSKLDSMSASKAFIVARSTPALLAIGVLVSE